MMLFMGIDVGSSGCKVSVVDETGILKCSSHQPYSFSYNGDFSEIDPNIVFNAVLDSIRDITSRYDLSELATLSVTSFGEMFVLVDENRNVLCNSISYSDPRGTEQIEEMMSINDKVYSITGTTVNPMYSLPKLLWIKENNPAIYKKAYKMCMFADFILVKLGADFHIDYSLAARTLMFDIKKRCWSIKILNYSKIDKALLPPLVPSGEVVGEIDTRISELTGLPKSVKLLAGGHDQSCAALGAGIIRDGIALDGMGSNECIVPCFDRPMLNDTMKISNLACIPYMLPDKYVTYAFNKTAGTVFDWYKKIIGADSYNSMLQQMSDKPTGMFFMPHFAGAATPYMDDNSTGAIVGLNLTTSRGDLTKSIIEGLNYEIKVNLKCLEKAGFTLNEMYVAGGMSNSDEILKIKADILGMPIKRLEISQTGTLAMAIFGSVAMGIYEDIPTAVKNLVRSGSVFIPNENNHNAYCELFDKYEKMYNAVKTIYGRK